MIGLASECGVFFEASMPGCSSHHGGDDHPAGLYCEALEHFGSGEASEVDTDGEEHLVGKGGEVEEGLDGWRQDIEGEEVSAGEEFEGEEDEDEGGDLEDPEGEHGHSERDQELEQGGEEDGEREGSEGQERVRGDEVFTEEERE